MASILIADDIPEIVSMLVELVETVGHVCQTAENGKECLDCFEQGQFDVVLVDYSMTPVDGLCVLQKIRKSSPNVPVLVMTGLEMTELAERLKNEGAFAVIEKPFEIQDLLSIIQSALDAGKIAK